MFSLSELDAEAERIRGAFVVEVTINASNRPAALPDDELEVRYRRRVFLTVAAAEHAARLAQARGESARVYLCEVRPLHRVVGGELA